jgi:hypothetical protein
MPLGVEIGLDDVANEVAPAFCYSLRRRHQVIHLCRLARPCLVPNPRLRAKG